MVWCYVICLLFGLLFDYYSWLSLAFDLILMLFVVLVLVGLLSLFVVWVVVWFACGYLFWFVIWLN